MLKMIDATKTAFRDFVDDECMVSGAALAYYTIFSLPPLLVLVFYVAGAFGISQERINEVVRKQAGVPVSSMASQGGSGEQASGKEGGGGTTMSNVAERRGSKAGPMKSLGPVSKFVGIALLIFTATGVFAQLQHALNRAWEVEPDPEAGGVKSFFGKRLLSLGMILVIAFLLLVSLALTVVVDEIVRTIQGQTPGPVATAIGYVVNAAMTLAMATLLFAALYKVLPDADMRWKDLWVGAFITAVLFVAGKFLLGWYLQSGSIGASWGSAAASLIVILAWVYYTSLIVLFGAELTQAWVARSGEGIRPSKGAVRVVEKKVHVRPGEGKPAQAG